MIQESFSEVFHNEYHAQQPTAHSRILHFEGREVLCRWEDGVLTLPQRGEFAQKDGRFTYLFTIGSQTYFLLHDAPETVPQGFGRQPFTVFRTATPHAAAFAVVTGWQLYNWYRDSRYCGRCGGETVQDEKERMMYCPHCKNMIYPRISPAVIVAVTSGERLLLTRYANRPGSTGHALIAGFNEIGESIEATVRREVMEEVGLRVKNLRYYRSQPWSLTGCLLMGFWCEVDGDDTIHLDHNELADGVWLRPEEIDWDDNGISLTGEMTQRFKEGRMEGEPVCTF